MSRDYLANPLIQSGRGSGVQDYIAFWSDHRGERHATAVRVATPVHDHVRGSALEEYIIEAVKDAQPARPVGVLLLGAMSLYGPDREIVVGDGRAGQATFTGDAWRVDI